MASQSAAAPLAGKPARRPLSQSVKSQRLAGMLLVTPATVLLISLLLAPSALVIILSFTDYRLGMKALKFVGIDVYAELFRDPHFWNSLRNTAIYVAIVVPGSVILGLLAALLIERRGLLRNFYSVAYFLPVTATLVASATAWEVALHPNFGIVNSVLVALGGTKLRFLSDPNLALYTLSAIGVWELVGFNMVLFLAGLSTIPKEMYEAAAVDGATGGLSRFRMVTWPMLGPVALFVMVLTAIRAFRVFETTAVLTQGGPNGSTNVILYMLFEQGFRFFRVGYASALAVVFLVFTTILVLLQVRFLDRRVHYT